MRTSALRAFLMRILRAPFMPVLMHIDRRIQPLHQHLAALENRMAYQEALIVEQGQNLHRDAQAMIQGAAFVERSADALTGTVELMEKTQAELREMIRAQVESHKRMVEVPFANRALADVPAEKP